MSIVGLPLPRQEDSKIEEYADTHKAAHYEVGEVTPAFSLSLG
jgi:hypothetical protein